MKGRMEAKLPFTYKRGPCSSVTLVGAWEVGLLAAHWTPGNRKANLSTEKFFFPYNKKTNLLSWGYNKSNQYKKEGGYPCHFTVIANSPTLPHSLPQSLQGPAPLVRLHSAWEASMTLVTLPCQLLSHQDRKLRSRPSLSP